MVNRAVQGRLAEMNSGLVNADKFMRTWGFHHMGKQIAANLEHAPATAQTGPLARGDRQTVRANLEALGTDPYRDVYAAFVRAVAPELLEGSS